VSGEFATRFLAGIKHAALNSDLIRLRFELVDLGLLLRREVGKRT
jgi:hypothetical protein